MFALVDCNSFFCAVERVFHPGLRGIPVCVLSNNDGCIVALTPEAKALGLKRGDPLFKVRDVVAQGGVRVFSGNLMLYAAMSRRINRILRHHIHYVETYSIDECFCNLQGYDQFHNLADFMRTIANTIDRYTGIPVSVGIAPTKTLAKMGTNLPNNTKAIAPFASSTPKRSDARLSASSRWPTCGASGETPCATCRPMA